MTPPNALFAIVNVSNPAGMKTALDRISPWVSLELQEGQWLLIAPNATTTQEVTTRLGFADTSSKDTAVILRVENYFGRTYPTVWEWIATKLGAELGVASTA